METDSETIRHQTSQNKGWCISCLQYEYTRKITQYPIEVSNGNTILIPNILILICEECGKQSIPLTSQRKLDKEKSRINYNVLHYGFHYDY